MYWTSIFLIIAALLGSMKLNDSVALAQSDSQDKKRECLTLLEERTAATDAKDWKQLEKLAKRYLQNCKGVDDSEWYSTGYENLGAANIQLNNAMAALTASETCIDIYYRNAGCHINKVQALIKLKRLSEARNSIEIAERLLAHVTDKNERDLRETSDPLKKEVYSSKQVHLNSLKRLLDSLRRFIDKT